MPALIQGEAHSLLDSSLASTFLALLTAQPTVTSNQATAGGTEVANSGGSTYARQSIPWNASSGGQKTNSGALNFAGMPAATVTGVQIMSAATAGTAKWYGPLATARTTAAGDSLQVASGQLTASLA